MKYLMILTICENLIQFKKLYLQHLAAGGEEREDHEDIVNFEPLSETLDAPLITQAYKNVITITRLYILNNIYYPAGKKLLWRDLSSIDCLEHALSLEYILYKSEFPGVALHHCTEQWSCRNILTEKMRSMQRDKVKKKVVYFLAFFFNCRIQLLMLRLLAL
ncbi:unnamed protein product [Rhizopus stolonifer]